MRYNTSELILMSVEHDINCLCILQSIPEVNRVEMKLMKNPRNKKNKKNVLIKGYILYIDKPGRFFDEKETITVDLPSRLVLDFYSVSSNFFNISDLCLHFDDIVKRIKNGIEKKYNIRDEISRQPRLLTLPTGD